MGRILEVTIDLVHESIYLESDEELDRNFIASALAKIDYPDRGANKTLLKAKSYLSCAI